MNILLRVIACTTMLVGALKYVIFAQTAKTRHILVCEYGLLESYQHFRHERTTAIRWSDITSISIDTSPYGLSYRDDTGKSKTIIIGKSIQNYEELGSLIAERSREFIPPQTLISLKDALSALLKRTRQTNPETPAIPQLPAEDGARSETAPANVSATFSEEDAQLCETYQLGAPQSLHIMRSQLNSVAVVFTLIIAVPLILFYTTYVPRIGFYDLPSTLLSVLLIIAIPLGYMFLLFAIMMTPAILALKVARDRAKNRSGARYQIQLLATLLRFVSAWQERQPRILACEYGLLVIDKIRGEQVIKAINWHDIDNIATDVAAYYHIRYQDITDDEVHILTITSRYRNHHQLMAYILDHEAEFASSDPQA